MAPNSLGLVREGAEAQEAGRPAPRSLRSARTLPAALCEAVRLRDLVYVDADHGLAQAAGGLGDDVRIIEEGGGLHDGGGALGRVAGLEDTGADKHTVGAELHHH